MELTLIDGIVLFLTILLQVLESLLWGPIRLLQALWAQTAPDSGANEALEAVFALISLPMQVLFFIVNSVFSGLVDLLTSLQILLGV